MKTAIRTCRCPEAFHELGLHTREGVLPGPRWLRALAQLLR
ncbi:hypothetical protein SAMN05428985_102628 [Nocardioides sp. YR527]|nr:hypothetical protein [Nocardioides sp. YR527]SDK09319.1 hypothetical protein SAMN05428985_102628 [Nocardioides sp. YR527]